MVFFVAKRGTRTKNLGKTAVDFGQNIRLYCAQKLVNTAPIPLLNLNVSNTSPSVTFGVVIAEWIDLVKGMLGCGFCCIYNLLSY